MVKQWCVCIGDLEDTNTIVAYREWTLQGFQTRSMIETVIQEKCDVGRDNVFLGCG